MQKIKSLAPVAIGFFAISLVAATCVATDYLWHNYIHHHHWVNLVQ